VSGNKKEKSKRNKFLTGFFTLLFIIGIVASVGKEFSVEKHAKIDEWYKDETGRFIDDDDDELLEAMEAFYDKTGVQPYVLVTPSRFHIGIDDTYYEVFDDNEHVLIYISEQSSDTTSNLLFRQGSSNSNNEANDAAIYTYEVDIYTGAEGLNASQMNTLNRYMERMDLEPGNDKYEELVMAFEKATASIDNGVGEKVIYNLIKLVFSVLPTVFFFGFILFIVKIANAQNKKSAAPTTAPYPTPTVKTIDISQIDENIAPINKPVFKPAPTAQPVQATVAPAKPVAPVKPVAPAKPEVPVKPETPVKPVVTEFTLEPVQIPAPEAAAESINIDPISITPIEPIKIEPISFDLDANNVLDNLGDANYDIPNVINNDNFNDWGNL